MSLLRTFSLLLWSENVSIHIMYTSAGIYGTNPAYSPLMYICGSSGGGDRKCIQLCGWRWWSTFPVRGIEGVSSFLVFESMLHWPWISSSISASIHSLTDLDSENAGKHSCATRQAILAGVLHRSICWRHCWYQNSLDIRDSDPSLMLCMAFIAQIQPSSLHMKTDMPDSLAFL